MSFEGARKRKKDWCSRLPEDVEEGVVYEPDSGVFYHDSWPLSVRLIKHAHGYDPRVFVAGYQIPAARLAFQIMGVELDDLIVDFVNGDKADLSWRNLRAVKRAEHSYIAFYRRKERRQRNGSPCYGSAVCKCEKCDQERYELRERFAQKYGIRGSDSYPE